MRATSTLTAAVSAAQESTREARNAASDRVSDFMRGAEYCRQESCVAVGLHLQGQNFQRSSALDCRHPDTARISGVARRKLLSDSAAHLVGGFCRVTAFSSAVVSDVRRRNVSRYATLTHMQPPAVAPYTTGFSPRMANAWLTRRWYYTPKTHRAYSVRQISPGDRRLLAEFVLGLSRDAPEREVTAARAVSTLLFDRMILADSQDAMGFAALESTAAGDRVIGAAAYTPNGDSAEFCVAVASAYRDEQLGRTLLSALVRHARRVGVARLVGEMWWSNRPMQMLAHSIGFVVEPVPRDRNMRRLVMALR